MKYEIIGRKWDTENKIFYDFDKEHQFPYFKEIATRNFEVEANSLTEAHAWFLENYPEWSVGCGIRCLENSDFLCDAVISYYYRHFGMLDAKEIAAKNLSLLKKRMSVTV